MPDTEPIAALLAQVEDRYQAADHAQGIALATSARDLAARTVGDADPAFAACLGWLGRLHLASGEPAEAEQLLVGALDIQLTALGDDDVRVARCLDDLGELYAATSRYVDAENVLVRALAMQRRHLAADAPDVARSLNALGKVYLVKRRLPDAETAVAEALDIRRRQLGDDHLDTAQSLADLAAILYARGALAEAEPLLRRALAAVLRRYGEDHPSAAAIRMGLAAVVSGEGDHAAAAALIEPALASLKKRLGDDHLDVAAAMSDLGVIHLQAGNLAEAGPLLEEALAIRRRKLGEGHLDVAASLSNLANLYHERGDDLTAEPLLEEALASMRMQLGGDHPAVADVMGDLATVEAHLGRYDEARWLGRQALAIVEKSLGADHPDVARHERSLATLEADMGDYHAAESLLLSAAKRLRERDDADPAERAATSLQLAELYGYMGDCASAEPRAAEALAVLRERLGDDHPSVPDALDDLASIRRGLGKVEEARKLYGEALALEEKNLGADHPRVARTLTHLGDLIADGGQGADAEACFARALSILEKRFGDDHPDVAMLLIRLGWLQLVAQDTAAAEPLFRRALAGLRRSQGEAFPACATIMRALGLLLVGEQRADEAFAVVGELVPLEDRLLAQAFAIGSERTRAAQLASIDLTASILLTLCMRHFPGAAPAAGAALDLLLRRKGIQTEALGVQRDLVLGGRYPALAPALRELAALRAQIAQRTLEGPGGQPLDAYQQTLAAWDARKEQLEADLTRQIPEMSLEKTVRDATRAAVAAALPGGSALVEMARFEDATPRAAGSARYLAIVLAAGDPDGVRLVDLGEAAPIEDAVARFRASIGGAGEAIAGRDFDAPGAAGADDAAAAAELAALVFEPIRAAIGEARRLFLSPDGELCLVPFEVLPIGGGRRLVDAYHVSYVGSGRDVLRFGAGADSSAAPVVIADPDFELAGGAPADEVTAPAGRQSRELDRGALHFTRLPGTRGEGAAIAARLGVSPWLGGAALEGSLKAARSPRILHIATHGFFLPRPPAERAAPAQIDGELGRFSGAALESPLLRSGLALSGANTWLAGGTPPPGAEDGILNGEDVASLDLHGTELVVLSACQTGVGEIKSGDGVYGLRRAFIVAGARTVVMSLWRVPDAETQRLMTAFYDGLLAGKARSLALRDAELALAAESPDPRVWGAFILQGDPGPLG